jgi:hypothetical protein
MYNIGETALAFQKNYSIGSYKVCYGRKAEKTHTWLSAPGRIIDITADQFPSLNVKSFIHHDLDGDTVHLGFTVYRKETTGEALAKVID